MVYVYVGVFGDYLIFLDRNRNSYSDPRPLASSAVIETLEKVQNELKAIINNSDVFERCDFRFISYKVYFKKVESQFIVKMAWMTSK